MNIKKPVILISAISLLLIVGLPLVMADSLDPFSSLLSIFQSAINIVFKIFNLSFLGLGASGANRVAFMRFMIWIITFAIFNAALKFVFSKGRMQDFGSAGNGRLPAVISICLATITAVFMPDTVLLAIGMQYSAVWSAIILGGLFAGLLYVAYGMVKPLPNSAGGHLLRLGILFVCWILLLNFTAITDNPTGYTPSMSNTNINFVNPVLGFMWELLSAIVGILIIYELFKMFGAIGKSTVGNAGTNLSNAGNWVNNTRNGWDDLKDSLKGEEDIDKAESSDLNQISVDENREASALDNEISMGHKIHEKLIAIIGLLGIMKRELQEGRADSKHFLESLNLIIKNLNASLKLLKNQYSVNNWAYTFVQKEMHVVGELYGLIKGQNNLLEVVSTNIENMPKDDPLKPQLLADLNEVHSLVKKFTDAVDELAKKIRLKSQRIYDVLKPIQDSLSKVQSDVDSLTELRKSDSATIVITIDAVIKNLQDLLVTLKEREDFLSVAYTMNGNTKKELTAEFKGYLSAIETKLRALEVGFSKSKSAAAPKTK